jgi:hypothetical protein
MKHASLASTFAIVVGLAALGSAAPPAASSDVLARSCARKLQTLEERLGGASGASAMRVLFTTDELNAYIRVVLAPRLPPGLRGFKLTLGKDRLRLQAEVDIARVKAELPADRAASLGLLNGTLSVEVGGRFKSDDGFGQFQIETARIGPVIVEAPAIERLCLSFTQSAEYPQGIDLAAPFRLPFALKKARLRDDGLLLEF